MKESDHSEAKKMSSNLECSFFAVDDRLVSKLDIAHLFGKEVIENVQKTIAGVTGLAMVTVDYKGDPVTEPTSFTPFCTENRTDEKRFQRCRASDAFGSIQATVLKNRFVYFCPCGLMEMAIPITFKGQYLGGLLCGQVRCVNAPPGLSSLENVMKLDFNFRDDPKLFELYNETPIWDYDNFCRVADMAALVIQLICEREVFRRIQDTSVSDELDECKKQLESLELEKANAEWASKRQINPHSIISVLDAASNLSIIENAPRTNEILLLLVQNIKEMVQTKTVWSLFEEINVVERYLKMQKIRYGSTFEFVIMVPDRLKLQKIPRYVILPFVERAVFFSMAARNQGLQIVVSVSNEDDDVVIRVTDNGYIWSEEEIVKRYSVLESGNEVDTILSDVSTARKQLMDFFGKDYDVVIQTETGLGSEYVIRIPSRFVGKDT
jgi:ligand-binding sensor protein